MVTELQFIAVAAFLIWGLVSSLCGVLTNAPDTARLVWHRHGPATDVDAEFADSSGRDGVSGTEPHDRVV
jgi:hypothetical protein